MLERENKESQPNTPSEILQKIRCRNVSLTASPDECPVKEVPEVEARVLHKVKVKMRAAEIATIDFLLDIEKGG